MNNWKPFLTVLALWSIAAAQTTRPASAPPGWKLNAALPTVFLAGDSTAQVGDPKHTGWGKFFAQYIDPDKANWVNAAIGGRSSRTYVTEGRWERVHAALKPGDWVFIQFGHNDGAGLDTRPFRASLPGIGDETRDVNNTMTGVHETIHTYGWYMKKMVEETRAKGAMPIIIALTVRDIWKDGRVERAVGRYNEWARQVAVAEHVAYIDLTDLIADRYEQMGQPEVVKMFPADHTHTGPDGAALNAQLVLSGVKALHRQLLIQLLSPAARDIIPATQPSVILGRAARGPQSAAFDEANFLNRYMPADPKLPSIILIGDSTVRNGRGDGADGQWGWGEALAAWVDPDKANLVNRALGGTTSRSFMGLEWPGVLPLIKPGDIVIMQFGTNNDGPPTGIGEETQQIPNRGGGGTTLAHTYGWYLRKYIGDIRAKGATPLVCTLVPRNIWKDGKFITNDVHADWARQVAKDQNVGLLDLNKTGALRYAALGQKGATAVFADGRVHTNHDGAEILASVVVDELKALPDDPAAAYLRERPLQSW